MPSNPIKTRIKNKIDTTAHWIAVDENQEPTSIVLLDGEIGLERTTSGKVKIKVGDGQHNWSELPYVGEDIHIGANAPAASDKYKIWIEPDAEGDELELGSKAFYIDVEQYVPDGESEPQFRFVSGKEPTVAEVLAEYNKESTLVMRENINIEMDNETITFYRYYPLLVALPHEEEPAFAFGGNQQPSILESDIDAFILISMGVNAGNFNLELEIIPNASQIELAENGGLKYDTNGKLTTTYGDPEDLLTSFCSMENITTSNTTLLEDPTQYPDINSSAKVYFPFEENAPSITPGPIVQTMMASDEAPMYLYEEHKFKIIVKNSDGDTIATYNHVTHSLDEKMGLIEFNTGVFTSNLISLLAAKNMGQEISDSDIASELKFSITEDSISVGVLMDDDVPYYYIGATSLDVASVEIYEEQTLGKTLPKAAFRLGDGLTINDNCIISSSYGLGEEKTPVESPNSLSNMRLRSNDFDSFDGNPISNTLKVFCSNGSSWTSQSNISTVEARQTCSQLFIDKIKALNSTITCYFGNEVDFSAYMDDLNKMPINNKIECHSIDEYKYGSSSQTNIDILLYQLQNAGHLSQNLDLNKYNTGMFVGTYNTTSSLIDISNDILTIAESNEYDYGFAIGIAINYDTKEVRYWLWTNNTNWIEQATYEQMFICGIPIEVYGQIPATAIPGEFNYNDQNTSIVTGSCNVNQSRSCIICGDDNINTIADDAIMCGTYGKISNHNTRFAIGAGNGVGAEKNSFEIDQQGIVKRISGTTEYYYWDDSRKLNNQAQAQTATDTSDIVTKYNDLVDKYNSLLSALQSAGLMKTE